MTTDGEPVPTITGNRSEGSAQAEARRSELARCFEEVFGQPGRRTASQKRVFEHLALCAGSDANSYRFQEARDGLSIIAAGIHRDGAQSIVKIIFRQLEIAAKAKVEKKAKPQTKR